MTTPATTRPPRELHPHEHPPYTRDLGPDETLYFLHIHKNSGSSFRTCLHQQFDRDAICPFRWEPHRSRGVWLWPAG